MTQTGTPGEQSTGNNPIFFLPPPHRNSKLAQGAIPFGNISASPSKYIPTMKTPCLLGLLLAAPLAVASAADKPAASATANDIGTYLRLEQQMLDVIVSIKDEPGAKAAEPELKNMLQQVKKIEKTFPQEEPDPLPESWQIVYRKEANMYPIIMHIGEKLNADNFYDSAIVEEACSYLAASTGNSAQWLSGQQQQQFDTYADKPDPSKIDGMLRLGAGSGMMYYRIGFFSEIFRKHPDKLAAWRAIGEGMPGMDRIMVMTALRIADTPQAKKELAEYAKYDPLFANPSEESLPPLKALEKLEQEPEEAAYLDMAWGAYDASRNPEYLKAFVRCAVRNAPGDESDRVQQAARWSVKQRAAQTPAIRKIVDDYVKTLTPEQQKTFNEEGDLDKTKTYTPAVA